MPNWTHITVDELKASAHESLLEAAAALGVGRPVDPIAEAIGDAVALVRGACAVANVLDLDTAKVPNSLRGLTKRTAIYALSELVGLALTTDQSKQREADERRLERLMDERKKVEAPDVPAATGEMQASGRAVEAINVPPRLTGRERTSGL